MRAEKKLKSCLREVKISVQFLKISPVNFRVLGRGEFGLPRARQFPIISPPPPRSSIFFSRKRFNLKGKACVQGNKIDEFSLLPPVHPLHLKPLHVYRRSNLGLWQPPICLKEQGGGVTYAFALPKALMLHKHLGNRGVGCLFKKWEGIFFDGACNIAKSLFFNIKSTSFLRLSTSARKSKAGKKRGLKIFLAALI